MEEKDKRMTIFHLVSSGGRRGTLLATCECLYLVIYIPTYVQREPRRHTNMWYGQQGKQQQQNRNGRRAMHHYSVYIVPTYIHSMDTKTPPTVLVV